MTEDLTSPNLSISTPENEEKLAEKMSHIRLKEKEQEARARAMHAGLGYINLTGFPIDPETLSLFDQAQALEAKAICFFKNEQDLRVGVLDPYNQATITALEQLQTSHKVTVLPYIISEHSFASALKLYDALPKITHYVSGVRIDQEELTTYRSQVTTLQSLGELMGNVPFANLVSLMIAGALETRSSDIHVEAEQDDVKVRYRIDGVLHDVASLSREVWRQLLSRMKLLSKVKLNVVSKPQDGRFIIALPKEEIDVRASFLPTEYGESIVMRILRSSITTFELDQLGLRKEARAILEQEISRPNGMLLTTGPTGSGKTTTLYAILHSLNTPDKKIITIENPIEYRLKGVNQSQVDENAGHTFAKGLRSIMRQDPDIIMVGEIRDEESADIAINAALTGHLVLSTLHTNNAPGAIPRFIGMQVKPYLLAPAVNLVIAQRLVRKICADCKKEIQLDAMTLDRVKKLLQEIPASSGVSVNIEHMRFYEGAGCTKCQGIGYKGRIGIFELFQMNETIEQMIMANAISEREIAHAAVAQGMISMAQDGLLKALDGTTSVSEVFKVAQ